MRTKLALTLLISTLGLHANPVQAIDCSGSTVSKSALQELKQNQWQVADAATRNQLARDLLPCLGSRDSELRDNLSFEALSHWMRNQLLDKASLDFLRLQLLQQLASQTAEDATQGFALPFAVLTLAEISRVDRRQPFLEPTQRDELVTAAANFIRNWHDYRGFDERDGWRHGIAHAADWALQLALNPQLSKPQLQSLLDALALQINTNQHFYIYGEPARFMAPVFWIAKSGQFRLPEWQAWFSQFRAPAPEPGHQYTQAGLAKRHNLSAFLLALYYSVREANDPALKEQFLPALKQSLQELR